MYVRYVCTSIHHMTSATKHEKTTFSLSLCLVTILWYYCRVQTCGRAYCSEKHTTWLRRMLQIQRTASQMKSCCSRVFISQRRFVNLAHFYCLALCATEWYMLLIFCLLIALMVRVKMMKNIFKNVFRCYFTDDLHKFILHAVDIMNMKYWRR